MSTCAFTGRANFDIHGAAVQDVAEQISELNKKLVNVAEQRDRATHERDQYQKLYELATLELSRLRRHIFGQKAEKVSTGQMQMAFSQVQKLVEELQGAAAQSSARTKQSPRQAKPHGRQPLPEHLPIERIELEPAQHIRDSGTRIGEEISETLEWRRGGYVRVQVVRPKYAEKRADGATQIAVAEPPCKPIPKGLAGPGLLARVIVSKFADHLPLHRQSEMFAREKITLAPSTLGGWLEPCSALLKPVVDAMFRAAMGAHCIAIDATGVLVQAKSKCKRGHFWVMVADQDHVLFRFSRKHNSATVKTLLPDFKGYLLADAAKVYDQLYNDAPVTEVGCWAHCRRRFFDALLTDAERAHVALAFIREIYAAHDATRDLPPSKRTAARRERAGPVVARFFEWTDAESLCALPKSPIGEAMTYARNQRHALTRFLEDGSLRLDNNAAELALRAQAVGRKNWLFVGSDDGAEWNTTFVSLIASCKLHGVEPWAYVRDLLCLLPTWPADRALALAPKYWAKTCEDRDTQRILEADLFRRISAD